MGQAVFPSTGKFIFTMMFSFMSNLLNLNIPYFSKRLDALLQISLMFQAKPKIKEAPTVTSATEKVDVLDLDDLDLTPQRAVLSQEASGGRTGAEIR